MAIPVDPRSVQPKGTGFTNIQRIVQANRPERLGQAVSSGVTKTVESANTELDKQKSNFAEHSQKNMIGTDQDKQFADQAINDPTMAGAAQRFEEYRRGYQGPQGLQDTATLQSKGQQLGGISKAIGQTGGQQALLQRFVGNPQYNQGQQRLDTMLLGQSGGGALKAARRDALNAQQNIGQTQTEAEIRAQNLVGQADTFNREIGQKLDTTQADQIAALQARAGEATAGAKTRRDVFNKIFSNPQEMTEAEITQAEDLFRELGLDPNAGTYDLFNPANQGRYAGNVQDANINQVANDQERSRYEALNKLAGRNAAVQLGKEDAYNQLAAFDPKTLQADAQARRGELDTAISRDAIGGAVGARQAAKSNVDSMKTKVVNDPNIMNAVTAAQASLASGQPWAAQDAIINSLRPYMQSGQIMGDDLDVVRQILGKEFSSIGNYDGYGGFNNTMTPEKMQQALQAGLDAASARRQGQITESEARKQAMEKEAGAFTSLRDRIRASGINKGSTTPGTTGIL